MSKRRIILTIAILSLIAVLGLLSMLKKEPVWGVNFSEKVSGEMGLDWRAVYDGILDDLKVRRLRISVHWNLIETSPGIYAWDNLDHQVRRAEEVGAKLTLAIGRKTPRWPECHLPEWAKTSSLEDQRSSLRDLLRAIVLRYKNSPALERWQVENEPFLPFGECSLWPKESLAEEIDLVRSLDPDRPILVTESGELSMWWRIAPYGDLVGVTMYRRVWSDVFERYITFPIPAVWYRLKAAIVKAVFHKPVLNVELQMEPWGDGLPSKVSPEKEAYTMSPRLFVNNLNYARHTGLAEVYLWGAEWWYFKKTVQNDPAYWNLAKELFKSE